MGYAHEDADVAYGEMAWIHDAGFNLWYDEGIHVGTVWRQALADAISGSSGLIFLATERSVNSSNCLKEINFVLDEEKPVFVVQLDETPLPSLLRLALSDRQSLVKPEFDEPTYRSRLVSALKSVVEPVPRGAARGGAGAAPETERPSIAVIPFASLSQDPNLTMLAEGIAGSIVNRLTGISWLQLVGGRVTDQKLDAREIGDSHQVRYVISGHLQQSGDRLRATAILTVAEDGRQLWAQHYDRTMEDPFALQDQLAESIWFDMNPAFFAAEATRAQSVPAEELDAWGLAIRANRIVVTNRATRDEKLTLLLRAVELDPNFAFAHAVLAGTLAMNVLTMFTRNPEEDKRRALEHADSTLANTKGLYELQVGSVVHRAFGNESYGLRLAERYSEGLGRDTSVLYDALTQLDRADEVLSRPIPLDPANVRVSLHTACMVAGRYEEALGWSEKIVADTPGGYLRRAEWANVLALLDRIEEAEEAIKQVKEIVPTWTMALYEKGIRLTWRDRAHVVEPLLAGLRKLGID